MNTYVYKSTLRSQIILWGMLLVFMVMGMDHRIMAGDDDNLKIDEVSFNQIDLIQDDDNEGFGPIVPLTITGSVNVRNGWTTSNEIVGAFENITIYGRFFGTNEGYDWYFISEEPDLPNFVMADGSARFIAAVPGIVEVGEPINEERIAEDAPSEIPPGPDAGGVRINPAPVFNIDDVSDAVAGLVNTTEARIPDIEETLNITVVAQQWMNDGNLGPFENIPPVLILRTQASLDSFGDFVLQDVAEGTPYMMVPINGENVTMNFSSLDGLQLNLLQALAINAGVSTAEEFVTFLENLVPGAYEGQVYAYSPESDAVEEVVFDPALPLIIIHEGVWQRTTGEERLDIEDIDQGYRQAYQQFVVRYTTGENGQLQMQLWTHQIPYERSLEILQAYPDYGPTSFASSTTNNLISAIRGLHADHMQGLLFNSIEGPYTLELALEGLEATPTTTPWDLLEGLDPFWPIFSNPGINPTWSSDNTDPSIFSYQLNYQPIVPTIILDYVDQVE